MRKPEERFTYVTDSLRRSILLAVAREGGIGPFARITGIQERRVRAVLCQRFVSENWLDRFCTLASTDVWITDFDFFTIKELKDRGDWSRAGGGWNRGLKTPEETRKKLSEAAKKRHQEKGATETSPGEKRTGR